MRTSNETAGAAPAPVPGTTARQGALRRMRSRRDLLAPGADLRPGEGEEPADLLARARVRVLAVHSDGIVRDPAGLHPLAGPPAARGAARQAISVLRATLHAGRRGAPLAATAP